MKLSMITEKLDQFKNGQISLSEVWEKIDDELDKIDRLEDDDNTPLEFGVSAGSKWFAKQEA